ncbi:MAG: tRNA (adenosine(37)-N6)-threonylcarbamoyltransferase complex ATPase subunit type 1 TsaE [Roseobacter sp.]
MLTHPLHLDFKTETETADFAARLAANLDPGDTILLSGPVGSGKTHFARSLIQAILQIPEDVPSPTFTLVQTYETTRGSLWHSDLYRLTSTFEVEELGLPEAFETAICLIEWPDRLGDTTPINALSLSFSQGADENHRTVTASWNDSQWEKKMAIWMT